MADIDFTYTQVKVLKVEDCLITPEVAGAALTAGQVVYQNGTTGKVHPADANDTDTENGIGIVLADTRTNATNTNFASGSTVQVLRCGAVGGYDLSNVNYDGRVWVSETAGDLADAAPANAVIMGYCFGVWEQGDSTPTKYLYIDRTIPAAI